MSAAPVGDVDLDHRPIRINKAWKRKGEDDATDTPGWLGKQLKAKATMRISEIIGTALTGGTIRRKAGA